MTDTSLLEKEFDAEVEKFLVVMALDERSAGHIRRLVAVAKTVGVAKGARHMADVAAKSFPFASAGSPERTD